MVCLNQCPSTHTHISELQLAALLGKTLLEQNSELDTKLRKLQEFAEETLVMNQVRGSLLKLSLEIRKFPLFPVTALVHKLWVHLKKYHIYYT